MSDEPTLTLEAARTELEQVQAWVANAQQQLPQAIARANWLAGYIAASSHVNGDAAP